MTPQHRYQLFDQAVSVLEEELNIMWAAVVRMEKAANNADVKRVAELRFGAIRLEVLKGLSAVQKAKYAKVSFR